MSGTRTRRVMGLARGLRRRLSSDVVGLPRFMGAVPELVRTPLLAKSAGAEVVWLSGPDRITNPSIAETPEGYVVAARSVPYRLSRLRRRGVDLPGAPPERTMTGAAARLTGLAVLTRTLEQPAGYAGRAFEDPRLFHWRGATWGLWTVSTPMEGGRHRNSMMLGRVDLETSAVHDAVEIASPRDSAREKNWMPLVRGERLYFVYDLGAGLVFEYVDDERLAPAHASPAGHLAGESGSSQFIRFGDGWLGVSHRRLDRPFLLAWLPVAFYRHRFVLLDADLAVARVSRSFFLVRRDVEFCAGIVADQDSVALSFGVQDARAAMLRLPRARVEEMLDPGDVLAASGSGARVAEDAAGGALHV